MLDFLFSFTQKKGHAFAAALSRFRPDQPICRYEGEWGALVTLGEPYPGFATVDTERYLITVLGGPLPREDETAPRENSADDGVRWILERWKLRGGIRWDEDLVGHFLVLCIDKKEKTAEIATDINAFVSAYRSEEMPLVMGSHADAVAWATNSPHEIDLLSIADFLTFAAVTYPFTMYKKIRHLPPASVIRFTPGAPPTSEAYWEPSETVGFNDIREAAQQLRQVITANVQRMCEGHQVVGLLMSGGEDSRVVASLIPKTTRGMAITMTDSLNREARIAHALCSALGLQWESVTRSPTHYLDHARSSIGLTESHNFFLHAHVNGLVDRLVAGRPVLGGLMSDAFCKASHLPCKTFWGFKYAARLQDWKYAARRFNCPFAEQLEQRRLRHNEYLEKMRPLSWAEWHSLYPANMNNNVTNLFINRRMFPAYEPFADALVVKMSAVVPQEWKINRRLFHRAMRPLLRKTWWIRRGNGTYPALGTSANTVFFKLHRVINNARVKLAKYRKSTMPNDGPWTNYTDLARHPKFAEIRPADGEILAAALPDAERDALQSLLASCDAKGSTPLKFRALQVRLWLKSIADRQDDVLQPQQQTESRANSPRSA